MPELCNLWGCAEVRQVAADVLPKFDLHNFCCLIAISGSNVDAGLRDLAVHLDGSTAIRQLMKELTVTLEAAHGMCEQTAEPSREL